MAWTKGMHSPNPNGRPPLPPEVREHITKHGARMTVLALRALERAMAQGKNIPASVRAAEVWLNKTLADAAVALELSGPGGGPIPQADLSQMPADKLRLLLELLATVRAADR